MIEELEYQEEAGGEHPSSFDRQVLLNNSITILQRLESRLSGDRFKARESDREYLQFIRAYAGLLSAVNTVAKDKEVDELREEMDALLEEQEDN